MRIGEIAAAAAMDVETVRFYEREGLLTPPPRLPNGYRAYTAAHLERLTFIRRCRSLDLGLDDVRSLIVLLEQPGVACSAVDEMVDSHLVRVRSRIASLRALERQLNVLRSRCGKPSTTERCGIIGDLASRTRRSAV